MKLAKAIGLLQEVDKGMGPEKEMIGITKGGWKLMEISEGDRRTFIGLTDEYQVVNDNGVECIATMGTG